MSIAGWLANVLIVVGQFCLGYRWRHAFLFSIFGELIWSAKAWWTGQYDLAFICLVFCALAFRNWRKWGMDG